MNPGHSVVIWLVFSVSLGGCLFREHAAFEEARARYEACLADHSGYPQACDPLKAEADQRYLEYEKAAERSWGNEHRPGNPEDPGLPD